MQIKHKTALLLLFPTFLVLCLLLLSAWPRSAWAADGSAIAEAMGSEWLFYLALASVIGLVCALLLACVLYFRLRLQRRLLCPNRNCRSNPLAQPDDKGAFDYRDFETPREFLCHSVDVSQTAEQASTRLVGQFPTLPTSAHYRPEQIAQAVNWVGHSVEQGDVRTAPTAACAPKSRQSERGLGASSLALATNPQSTADLTLLMIERVIERHQRQTQAASGESAAVIRLVTLLQSAHSAAAGQSLSRKIS